MQGDPKNDTIGGGYCPVGDPADMERVLDPVLGFCRGIWVVQSLCNGTFDGSFNPGISFGWSYHWLCWSGMLHVFRSRIRDDLSLEA